MKLELVELRQLVKTLEFKVKAAGLTWKGKAEEALTAMDNL